MDIGKYAKKAVKLVYKNAEGAGGAAFALIIPIGVAAEYAVTGNYDPDKWIALGSAPLALGNAVKAFYVHNTENLDLGTAIRYVSLVPRIAGAAYLGVKSGLGYDAGSPESLGEVLRDIAIFGTSYIGGFAGERRGNAVKTAKSARWRIASRVDKMLKNEKHVLTPAELERLGQDIQDIQNIQGKR